MSTIAVEHSQIAEGNNTFNYAEDDLSSIANDRTMPPAVSVAASFLDEKSRTAFNYGSFSAAGRKREAPLFQLPSHSRLKRDGKGEKYLLDLEELLYTLPTARQQSMRDRDFIQFRTTFFNNYDFQLVKDTARKMQTLERTGSRSTTWKVRNLFSLFVFLPIIM